MAESDFIEQVLIHLRGRHNAFVHRQNTGKHKMTDAHGNERWVAYGTPGASDIIGTAMGGRTLAIECKRNAKDKPRPDQLEYLEGVRSRGGIALVIWPANWVELITKHVPIDMEGHMLQVMDFT